MRTLTEWEVDEFIEEALMRPSIWMGKDRLWVRRRKGLNQFAVKFVNGLPFEMSTLYVKVLDKTETEPEVERYVDWLLAKFTSYAWRMRVEAALRDELGGVVPTPHLEAIARRICKPEEQQRVVPEEPPVVETPLIAKNADWSDDGGVTWNRIEDGAPSSWTKNIKIRARNVPPPTVSAPSTPPPARSRYLINLLRKP